MYEITELEPDPNVLSNQHLIDGIFEGIKENYHHFRIIVELRSFVGPFLAALNFFSIRNREQFAQLHEFVNDKLLKDWESTTLKEVLDFRIIELFKREFKIDTEKPETLDAMRFIGSLVNNQNLSPLIEWLREKTKQDGQMEAIGKILSGTLLEAYGQLQTLRTRIASFLNEEFDTLQDLLQAIRESEDRFAQRFSDCDQPIQCYNSMNNWLTKMLPEIEAAVRISVVSPSEDAKEKLNKLGRVVIEPKEDTYLIQVYLEPDGSISIDEIKQAFQMLDMAVMEDKRDESFERSRKHVELIERFSQVFQLVFASGCITYTFQKPIVIKLDELEAYIETTRKKLDNWNKRWKEMENIPLLTALFSRGYLLLLADLIGRNQIDQVLSILKCVLPLTATRLTLEQFVEGAPRISKEQTSWLSLDELFEILNRLHRFVESISPPKKDELHHQPSYRDETLKSHFINQSVVILNSPKKLLVASALAAYTSITGQPIKPNRILFVMDNTDTQEIERFMLLWSLADQEDFFIIAHIERLTTAGANAVREGIDRSLRKLGAKLLLLAQQHHRTQWTKSLGARLGLISDRLLKTSLTVDQLRQCISSLLPRAANKLHFLTSKLPGCGKSQQAMELARDHVYYRIPVRTGSLEELLANLKSVENRSSHLKEQAIFLHLDVAHSVSLEFNDILLSLLIHGVLYDQKKPKLGFWMISEKTSIVIEFASPFGMDQFPIIGYLGQHHICECNQETFSYDLIAMPKSLGQSVIVNQSKALVVAGKFLKLKQAGEGGLTDWDSFCDNPQSITLNPLPKNETFELLVSAFEDKENKISPTFSALNAMASFLHRHICAMINSTWFSGSAVYLFEQSYFFKLFNRLSAEGCAQKFKLNVFELLLKVANDTITRCWSIIEKDKKIEEMGWNKRQRAMFIIGMDSQGDVSGVNIVGREAKALKQMFDPSLLKFLEGQGIQFLELSGFSKLLMSQEKAQVGVNAMRSLLLLDGTDTSKAKINQLDNHPRNESAGNRLRKLIGKDLGYVLTGDNIMKMMFALYRIRSGLPVVVFGETGVGKTALLRFLIQTLLGHKFLVCDVNSGTSISDVETKIQSAISEMNTDNQVFLFFDEMNTANGPVIAFLKELILDRHCNGTPLPENLHLMAAANPFRRLAQVDKEAVAGLAFRFTQTTKQVDSDDRNLAYRVNKLPLAFNDHVYDFGYLSSETENTYIDEICQHGLMSLKFTNARINRFAEIIKKSHQVARRLSSDPGSVVSLRDATRAVQLFIWFCNAPAAKEMIENSNEIASDLTVYLVYAFRFQEREKFLKQVFGAQQSASDNMNRVSRMITEKLYKEAHGASIGSGAIALNEALCENLFALYVCVLNGIFLIIVGRPGSSKSLSVEILKLVFSPENFTLRNSLGDLPAITELYFQCSPLSTWSGFKALFESAQRLSIDPKTMTAMVVLDELGLADLSPEKPIKVLHSVLERKSVLTSGEEKQPLPYSVVALSNWVVDAAQVNRAILVKRTQAKEKDLQHSAVQLVDSLMAKRFDRKCKGFSQIKKLLENHLKIVVNIYQTLDNRTDIGGGHFYSMRDFFYCVKNFLCSALDSIIITPTFRSVPVGSDYTYVQVSSVLEPHRDNFVINQDTLVQSVIRNFGGHEEAQKLTRKCLAENLEKNETTIPTTSPLDLIIQNIKDSSKPLSIDIARHLMILNRSMIGLQLLNRHVKKQLDEKIKWNILFGSCFPGDLQVTAVTRKLRQVEQAIRMGGVLILCHADQLFESLYMVLNQQYWTHGEVKMTHIALGPSNRAVALPSGTFRIIVLQDTDVALNRKLMSPAVLSRFEKHELKSTYLLDGKGRYWLDQIKSHRVWMTMSEDFERQKLMYGYHEESFSSLALHLQDRPKEINFEDAHAIWMRVVSPMAMIKLERDSGNDSKLLEECRRYRNNFVLEGIEDALNRIKSNRIVIMTNTLCHLEIQLQVYRCFVIQLFDIETELQLYKQLDLLKLKDLNDPSFCLIIQYDAVAGPIEQFQLTKYLIEQRYENTKCRVVFIVHVKPSSTFSHVNWVFSFGDEWDYCFVDEVVPAKQHQIISLNELVSSPADGTEKYLSTFIRNMSVESFKFLLLEMLGPILQTCLASLRSNLAQFFIKVRTALGTRQELIKLLQECLLAQLNECQIMWNVVDAVGDENFDSISSLTEALFGVIKHKIGNQLAHLLLVSDVWRVYDESSAVLWCDFVEDNYPSRLMSLSPPHSMVKIPVGFHSCSQLFGKFFTPNNIKVAHLKGPIKWLIDRLAEHEDDDAQKMRQAYFMDWFILHIPPRLHPCIKEIPLSKMNYLVNNLFIDPSRFSQEWQQQELNVIAALELVSIASFAKGNNTLWNDITNQIINWKFFNESTARISLETLGSQNVPKSRFTQSVCSIEVSSTLTQFLNEMEMLHNQWLALKITKRILLFDPESDITLTEEQVLKPLTFFEKITEFVIKSVFRPRVSSTNNQSVSQVDLYALLKITSTCNSAQELAKLIEDQFQHLRATDTYQVESLFQVHQQFMLFFENVAKLFIKQRRNNSSDILRFLEFLLSDDCRLQFPWWFLIVIVRSVLSTQPGVIDSILLKIRCNQMNSDLNANAYNLMRALIISIDQYVRQETDPKIKPQNIIQAAMTDNWTFERIRQLALIRRQLIINGPDETADFIAQWADWAKNQTDAALAESLLFFLLRFSSSEGDEIRLSKLYDRIDANVFNDYPVINRYMQSLSPYSLGFNLRSANKRAIPFQEHLLKGTRINDGVFECYPQLLAVQPEWGPFIARLTYHAADVFKTNKIQLLAHVSNNLIDAVNYHLPGIENHPFLVSFISDPKRWYLCDCGTLNCVGDCGCPTQESICMRCQQALSHVIHQARPGVRKATYADFVPSTGMSRTSIPTYFVRNVSPAVTRFSLLLNSLALMNASLDPQTNSEAINNFLRNLPTEERQQNEDRNSLIQLLANHIVVHLDILCQLIVTTRPQLYIKDRFRIGHLLLHGLLDSKDKKLKTAPSEFAAGTRAREAFENGLANLLANIQDKLVKELDDIENQCDEPTKNFRQAMLNNQESHWAYTRLVFADRQSVQLELARNDQLRQKFPFLNFVLDDENWMRRLDALQYLSGAIRFVALVRTVLQRKVTQNEANRMTIQDGLNRITGIVKNKAVILDRGRSIFSEEDVTQLFDSFKQLWDRLSQLENKEMKTFLEYFECQQIDITLRPKTILDKNASLILILAGNELPETAFGYQLLKHVVEVASSIAQIEFIQPHCRADLDHMQLDCSSTDALTNFDESLYAHVSSKKVDSFIRNHVIDGSTLHLAESFAKAAVLGPAGSTIVKNLSLKTIPEFVFKNEVESNNYLMVTLENCSIVWQPSPICLQVQERILAELEKNRKLAEAKSALISVITHLQSNTEPLLVQNVRNNYISDVLKTMLSSQILTEYHISTATLDAFDRYLMLEVRHVFGLLKAIVSRMQGDDIFGGRILDGWKTKIPEDLTQLMIHKLRSETCEILEILSNMANVILTSQDVVPAYLSPDQSLLNAIRQVLIIEDWDGIPVELKMEHLGYALLIAESLLKK